MVMEEEQSTMELASESVPVPQIQKSTKMSRAKTISKSSNVPRGKPRFRKKALHAAILKQMEFYFSDANLNKDRFLSGLIQKNPYVDLNVFVKCNKIRELTTSVERIAKALEGSTMLALSEDGTKVKRITEIVKRENIDECTIYVQNLAPDSDHETLITIFSQYGKVAYVSVPRYKSNKKIKGFAFVEFETPEEAQKCLESFKSKGCVLPLHTSPSDLLSIVTFDNVEKDVTLEGRPREQEEGHVSKSDTEKDMEVSESENVDTENVENEEKDECPDEESSKPQEIRKKSKRAKKRKHEGTEPSEVGDAFVESSEAEVVRAKKRKHAENKNAKDFETNAENEENANEGLQTVEEPQMSDVDQQDERSVEVVENNMMDDEQDTSDEKKKKRKRTRRSKAEYISSSMGLQIMAKKDWKHLRNKYLELQRTKMKQLKQHLRRARWNQWSNYEKCKTEKEEPEEKDKMSKENTTSIRNFAFTPGVIVKVEMNQPCTNPRAFKMELKGNSTVKYIDVEEGAFNAFIRCETPEAAQALTEKSSEERQMTILHDQDEKAYWDKMFQDRSEKLSKKVRVKQRGRDKLLKKAEKELGKHIKFDEV